MQYESNPVLLLLLQCNLRNDATQGQNTDKVRQRLFVQYGRETQLRTIKGMIVNKSQVEIMGPQKKTQQFTENK